jgi:tetratricopeptide (TPR) repeat protein
MGFQQFLSFIVIFFQASCLLMAQNTETEKKLTHAIALYRQNQFSQALDTFNHILSQDKKHNTALYFRAFSHLGMHSWEAAEKDFKALIRREYRESEAYDALGYLYNENKKYRKGIRTLNRVIRNNPLHASAYNNRGLCYHNLEKYRAAIKDFERAIYLDSNMKHAYNNLGCAIYYNQNIAKAHRMDILRARDYLNKALSMDPAFALAYRNRGVTHLLLGEYKKALRDFHIALNLNPYDFSSMVNCARAEIERENYTEAKKYLDHALQLTADFGEIYLYLGILESKKDNYSEAFQYLKQALRMEEKKKDAVFFELAGTYAKMQDKRKMMQYLRKAKRLGYFNDIDHFVSFRKNNNFLFFSRENYFIRFVKNCQTTK